MSKLTIAHQRLCNQQIAVSKFKTPAEIVSWLGAVQAQDYLGSLWAIGLRLKNINEEDIEQAISKREIVRTWPMRGTLHFVAPEDVRWMLKFLTPRVIQRSAVHYRQAELDNKTFTKSRKLFEKALEGGKQLTRGEMYHTLERSKISTSNQRGLHIIGHLAQQGFICLGPRIGKQHTFALLDEWIPSSKILKRDEAMAELAKRYFTSHGPATLEDFAWWAGLTKGDAINTVELIKSQFDHEIIEEQTYWFSTSGFSSTDLSQTYFLLPAYDEYLVSYKDRSASLDPKMQQNLIFTSTIITNGVAIGTWKRTIGKNEITLEVKTFDKNRKEKRGSLTYAIEHYSRFMKIPVKVT